ncbi:MAG: Phage SPO1 DNA polymerase-related protein [Candidatus Moranbacteria bacterium GW2011_GWC2_37_73]|nr:MAG: Phage SPO1 DNA polymerase-related protein [Parcubacteria group bacterium GW2011_GWC1_36_108]KKQ39395.1 MAG: Phage SPO1 DNA polymerase-related protein [Candidatus Moranbacteria bacterium GW2011_GWC2_37_73]
MSVCNNCKLRKNCSHVVFGAGNPEAKIIFIGEAPGKKEDELGVPFVGSTGRILDKMLASIKIKREDVYLTNICKCRPPENRDPLPEEVAECWPWLEKQIAIISPTIIITLGKYALNSFLPTAKISEVHGKIIDVEIKKIGKIKLFPLHHPAAARINRKTKALFEEDFQKIPNLLQSKKEQ